MDKPVFVGIMGYSGQKFDIDRAKQLLCEAFSLIEEKYPNRQIAVVSGYTNLGIPALAYAEATKRGWETIGVACSKAKEYEVFPCNKVYIVGENWGDESPVFLDMCKVFVRVGGGGQSLRECAQAKEDGKTVYEYELEAIK